MTKVGDSFLNVADGRQWRRAGADSGPSSYWADQPMGDRILAQKSGIMKAAFRTNSDPWTRVAEIFTDGFTKRHSDSSLLVTGHVQLANEIGAYGPMFTAVVQGEPTMTGTKDPPASELSMWMYQNRLWTHTWTFSRLIRNISAGTHQVVGYAGTTKGFVVFPKNGTWSIEVREVGFK